MINFNILKHISQHGKAYEPCILPENLISIRGEVGDCYDTCLMACMSYPHLRYVEGIARHPLTKEWILHAWVTDDENKLAFDLTWKALENETKREVKIPTEYVGVKVDTLGVMEFVKSTGYKGIFANYWRNRELASKLLGFTKK